MSQFDQFLTTELVRRYELKEGAIADAQVVAALNSASEQHSLPHKVHQRAARLAADLKLSARVAGWHSARHLVYALLAAIAVFSGATLARAALGGAEPISIAFALSVLLGVNFLMLFLWLLLMVVSNQGGGLGGVFFERIQQILLPRDKARSLLAGIAVANQQKLLKPAMATVAHGFWCLLLVVALVILSVLLAVQEYSFQWQTTLLSEAQVAGIAAWIGWLPERLGFAIPSTQALLDSSVQNHSNQAGRWILAMLLIYGVVPRLLFAFGCYAWFRSALRRMHLDLQAPGISELRLRLQPMASNSEVIDADPGQCGQQLQRGKPKHFGRGELVVSLDYDIDPDWNDTLWLNSAGVIASSTERKVLLADLESHTPARILVRINSQLSPDRGSLRFIQQLQQHCGALNAWIIGQGPYYEHWNEALAEIKVQLFTMPEEAVRWAQGEGQ